MSAQVWHADETLELHGVECPYTFVHAKLRLEEMEPGETLCIVIDHPPARRSLPASLAYEGHRVLGEIERREGEWEVWVVCGEAATGPRS